MEFGKCLEFASIVVAEPASVKDCWRQDSTAATGTIPARLRRSAMSLPERDTVMHSWCVQADWNAPTIVGGSGARFWDEAGRQFIDMSSLAECSNLGHQHPRVVAAIRRQAETLCFITSEWGARPRAGLAQSLLELSGYEGGRVFFTLGGADANEQAVKFARWASGKPVGKIVTRYRSYHGATTATMNLSGDSRGEHYPPAIPSVVRALPPYCYRCPFGLGFPSCELRCAAHVGEIIDFEGAQTVAAVLMEPHAGTNGIVAPDPYWPALREVCARRGVLLVADEVMSGFGRVGAWFAWQKHGEAGRPDMMTLAKGLTGGHVPLGAVIVSRGVCEPLERRMLYTGLTYCGHPLGCAAGLAALEAYREEKLIERARRLGAAMRDRLDEMAQAHRCVGDVRGEGMFAVLELVSDPVSRAPLTGWTQGGSPLRRLVDRGRERGVSFAVRGNLVILAPPLVITENDLAEALAVLDELLGEL